MSISEELNRLGVQVQFVRNLGSEFFCVGIRQRVEVQRRLVIQFELDHFDQSFLHFFGVWETTVFRFLVLLQINDVVRHHLFNGLFLL